MTHDELLTKINYDIEGNPYDEYMQAIRAVVEIAERFQDAKWVNKDFEEGFHVAINIVIQAIEKELG